MSVTIPTVHIYNIKDIISVKSKSINNIKDKWCGDYTSGLESENLKYIRRELKL